MFEHRVVIPPKYREKLLDNLHTAHLGIVKMKGMARSFIYWPGIDSDIENMVNQCDACAKHANRPEKSRDHHWEYPKGPWERIHIDYAGPLEGAMLLIISDAYSKWLEVRITKSITAASTIALLDDVFSAYGVPLTVVSDNGTNFTSAEFNDFLTSVGVKYHKYSAPYHPATNGQAERSVQTVKNALKAMGTTSSSLQKNLNEFLRQYKNAPHSTTGFSPALLFMGRQLRTRLDLVRPEEISKKVEEKQYRQSKEIVREFKPNQNVYFLSGNPRRCKWLRGTIGDRLGDLHYEVLFNGKRVKRHVDQIRKAPYEPNRTSPEADYYKLSFATKENVTEAADSRKTHVNEADELPIVNESRQNISLGPEEDLEGFASPNTTLRQDFTPALLTTPERAPESSEIPAAPRRSARQRKAPVIFSP